MYFDLHCHPSSKSFLTAIDQNKKVSPWKKIRAGFLQLLAPIFKSQSNLTQLLEGRVNLAVFGVVPIEKGFSNFWLLRDVVGIFTVLDQEFIREINYNMISYNQLFWDETRYLLKFANGKRGRKVKFIQSIEELDSSNKVINAIISVEGCHSLFNKIDEAEDLMGNLIKIKKSEEFSALYLTLTHLNVNKKCNHAYGAKITKDNIFKPSIDTKGITKDGLDIIDECYSKQNGKRILIDVKHMSRYARMQFYQYRKEKNFSKIPIIASHMGFTGFPLSQLPEKIEKGPKRSKINRNHYVVEYKEIKGISKEGKTDFNPWSINLFDEEIQEIIDSDGLIGISLDQRILGFGKNGKEYFRIDELDELTNLPEKPNDEIDEEEEDDITISDDLEELDYFEESNLNGRRRRHLRYLCNNILHVVKVAGVKGWEHICIGSDFDGLINPINNCKSTADYPDLEVDLRKELEDMMNEDYHNYERVDLTQTVRGFMYVNARTFLNKYFTMTYITK